MRSQKVTRKQAIGLGVGTAAVAALGKVELGAAQATPAATPVAQIDATPTNTFVSGVENLTYNNPFGQPLNPAWYDGQQVFHLFVGAVSEEPVFPTAPQYLFVYEDEFEDPSTVEGFTNQPKVEGQFVVYPAIPGQPDYTPIWHNQWVLVPREFEPNSITSVEQLMASGLRIVESPIWIN